MIMIDNALRRSARIAMNKEEIVEKRKMKKEHDKEKQPQYQND